MRFACQIIFSFNIFIVFLYM